MISKSSTWAAFAAMSTFVLLWGSAAIFTRWGLDHGSVFALLILRFSLALGALLLIGLPGRRWLPEPGTRWQVAATGLLLIGSYSVCYFQAMAHGITPGLLATLLGVQPILTLLLTERRFSAWRLCGLLLALSGLTLVVYQSLVLTKLSGLGMGFALGALLCMTFGAMLQKRIQQAPVEVLPLQYAVTLLLCLGFVPFQPFHFEPNLGFLVPLLWLGLGISIGAQLLLYRLIRSGNLVNVTSLFYLVPVVTVILDYLILGNAMPALAVSGMAAILAGLALVFRAPAASFGR
ncbi:DMT family transporter [Brenneria tiliae]|uniref:DMT family transporter n=1 Tax=Brenneria tiliae TaxID=2914984 RepID=A0ABT0MRW6_9GAMM|nr:DMT family transporter [Brenneria tiliae]MCL2892589.1 DMT family transporter [Brenneria tiliae]MCL2899633.1 DMT family transporter [Brenneria tiliae]MCL2904011.1 DMT family transporter [Brenneria tiliae]